MTATVEGRGRLRQRPSIADNPRYPTYVLWVTMVGVAASAFPSTLLSASLEVIRKDLGTTTSMVTWVQTAPTIAFAVAMPLFGKIGDLYGHRRTFIAGFTALAVSAVVTACAWDIGSLIAIRTVGQISGAATSTAAFGLIAAVFPREQRAKAIGLYTAVLAMSPVVAVVAGGPLIDALGWRVLFLAQAVPALAAVVAALPVLPETAKRTGLSFDVPGAALIALGITAVLFSVNRGQTLGWTHPAIVGGFVAGPLVLAAFLLVERRSREPLVPLELFGRRNVSAPVATNFLTQFTYIGGFTIAPFLVRRLFGYSTYETALIMAIRPVCFSLASWFAGRKDAVYGPRVIQVVASLTLALGTVLTSFGAWHRSLGLIVLALAVTGLGVGFGRPSNTAVVTNAVDDEDIGIATGMYNTLGTIGSAIGVTIVLAIVGDSRDPGPFAHACLVAAAVALASVLTAALTRDDRATRAVVTR